MEDVGIGYRVPELSEFVQEFEFELAKDSRLIWIDNNLSLEENKAHNDLIQFKRMWYPCKVNWMYDPKERIEVKHDGHMFNLSGATMNFFKPFDEESFIKQKLVRVKI
jgi:hypothetical protein